MNRVILGGVACSLLSLTNIVAISPSTSADLVTVPKLIYYFPMAQKWRGRWSPCYRTLVSCRSAFGIVDKGALS